MARVRTLKDIETIHRTSDRQEFTDLREAEEHQNMLIAREDLRKWAEVALAILPLAARRLAVSEIWARRSELIGILQTRA